MPEEESLDGNKSIHSVSVCFESNLVKVPSNTWWLGTGATTHVYNIKQDF